MRWIKFVMAGMVVAVMTSNGMGALPPIPKKAAKRPVPERECGIHRCRIEGRYCSLECKSVVLTAVGSQGRFSLWCDDTGTALYDLDGRSCSAQLKRIEQKEDPRYAVYLDALNPSQKWAISEQAMECGTYHYIWLLGKSDALVGKDWNFFSKATAKRLEE